MSGKDFKEWGQNLWPPFTQLASAPLPQRVIGGDQALLFLDDSTPLIDGISSWWVTLHGHANPYIANAISNQAQQLEQVIFADFKHPQAEKLAKRLSSITGLERLFFSDNGSTAVEVALKIACQWWHNRGETRKQLIAFKGAYHGDTFGAMALGERNLFNAPFQDMLFPVKHVQWPLTWWGDQTIETREQTALKELEECLETPTAAVIMEPLIQGAGGMQVVRESFLQSAEKLVRQSGALLIADEVLTGFGRCGSFFAYKRAELKPDLIALSKGLTGGFMPMGATMATEEIYQAFIGDDPKLTLWHGHSFTANPLGCAAANASLDLLEAKPDKYKNFEDRHRYHLNALSRHSKTLHPRLMGTIAAFDLNVDTQPGYLNPAGGIVKRKAMSMGVYIRPLGQVIYLMPPLCISDSQLEQCYAAIKAGLDEL